MVMAPQAPPGMLVEEPRFKTKDAEEEIKDKEEEEMSESGAQQMIDPLSLHEVCELKPFMLLNTH